MSILKKSDVKNHLSTRNHKEIHLYRPESESAIMSSPEKAAGVQGSVTSHEVDGLPPATTSSAIETTTVKA